MGSIKVHEFTTVDGVVDAPTWTMGHGFPDDLAAAIGALTAGADGILTYCAMDVAKWIKEGYN